MRVLLIDNGTTLLEKLRVLIPGDEIVMLPQSLPEAGPSEFDLIILSGSKDLTIAYDSEHFKQEIEMIQYAQIPIIGICFGCELIATAFGGSVKRMDERHSGVLQITSISDNETLGLQKGETYEVYEGHRWIVDTMPQDFKILAASKEGSEIIQHNTRPIWGFQFHPENLVDQTNGDEMFLRLFAKLKQK